MAFPETIDWTGASSLQDALAQVATEKTQWVSRMGTSGALLLRGLPLRGAADFDALVAAFGLRDYSYSESLSNAVRVELTPRVFTANEAPSSAVIALHHELAQTPHFPTHIFFYCDRPADRGGETTLCDSVALCDALHRHLPGFVRTCERRGLMYTAQMPAHDDAGSGQGRSWRSTFGVDSTGAAEAAMRELGYRWSWLSDGSLRTRSPALPAVAKDANGRPAFFNQLIAAWLGWQTGDSEADRPVAFGDGSPLAEADVQAVIEMADEFSADVAWRAGDVACVDNRAVMHGRRPFEGQRRVWAAFASAA